MTVFRGDSGNGEDIEPEEGREASGSAQVSKAPETEVTETGASAAEAPSTEAQRTPAQGTAAPGTERTAAQGTKGTAAQGAVAPTASAMRRALARARDGKPLDADEATVLLHARGDDLDALLAYAGRTRDAGLEAAGRPGVITYSRKVFIPLTRLCRDRCGYCTFATVPGRLDSPYLSPDEVIAIARQGAEIGRAHV